ncbi:MAG TPA: T9SS type A sorting domain-containing protein [Bacteroidales bacterium]|nr:T9SS type A sorting domain-containing protein [Bacteroidales bacterium]
MFKQLLLLLALLPITLFAQNMPACDSLLIECCDFNLTENSMIITAENQSSVLFDYPGFVILDANEDTIASETVNYFGIGWGPQQHTLSIYNAPELPFSGTLKLYTWFYESLSCTFDIIIPDTTLNNTSSHNKNDINIYPNPCNDQLWISWDDETDAPLQLSILNMNGQVVKEIKGVYSEAKVLNIDLTELKAVIYFISIETRNKSYFRKLIKSVF